MKTYEIWVTMGGEKFCYWTTEIYSAALSQVKLSRSEGWTVELRVVYN